MQNFEIIARAVIIDNDKILLCKRKDRDYYFLPGGHVEFGEKTEDALAREIKEELGAVSSEINFIGACENIFTQDGQKRHELNLAFAAKLAASRTISMEDHLEFKLVDFSEFTDTNVLPVALTQGVVRWLSDKQLFWVAYQS